jgi:hypothetical protein
MWRGMTIQQACSELNTDWLEMYKMMPIEVKQYVLNVSVLANAKEEYLGACTTAD